MVRLIMPLMSALAAGQELKDPAKWKRGQNLVNSVALIITGIVAIIRYNWPEFMATDEQIIEWASIGAAILAAINGYITTATTKKIGV